MKLQLGNEVRDKITGFTGTVTGKAKYITGCRQYSVLGKIADGKYPDSYWFDEGRLEYVSEGISLKEVTGEENGCDTPPPSKH